MKIEVDYVNKITPATNGGITPVVSIEVILRDYQAEKIFYQLWENYEGGLFEKWIDAEGYVLVKKKSGICPKCAYATTPQETEGCPSCGGTGKIIT
jgi:hypothetical protein